MKHSTVIAAVHDPLQAVELAGGSSNTPASTRQFMGGHVEAQGRERVDACGGTRPAPELFQVAPLLVLRGAKHQVDVGIDWLRMTGPIRSLISARVLFERRFGRPIAPITGRVFLQYEYGGRYEAEARFLHTDPRDDEGSVCIDVPGDALALKSAEEVLELLRALVALGFKATRIDCRLDWRAVEGVGLIDAVVGSCERGELCRARRWGIDRQLSNSGELLGNGVKLGARGKNGSGRYVRVYDKGLETGDAPAGQWERWEAEFSGGVAALVAELIASAESWVVQLVECALGAMDFREHNGQTNLSRRSRVTWWAQLLQDVEPIAVRERRKPRTLEKYFSWLRRCVAPTMKAMAETTGREVEEIFLYAVAPIRAKRDAAACAVVQEWRRWADELQPMAAGIVFP